MSIFNRAKETDRQWAIFERSQRATMQGMGYEQAEIDHACAVLRPLYARFGEGLSAGAKTGDELVAVINEYISRLVNGLLSEVGRREVEVLRLTEGRQNQGTYLH